MRHRRVPPIVAVLALLLTAGCSAGNDKDEAAPPAAGTELSAPAADLGSSANPIPGAPPDAGGPGESGIVEPAPDRPKPTGDSGSGSGPGAQLSANGLGPYQIASNRADLQAVGLLTAVQKSAACPDVQTAEGLSQYRAPALVFYRGKLQYTSVTSGKTATAEGAKVGMKLADVKRKYPAGKQLDDWNGAVAWFVAVGQNALLFRFEGGKVERIEAGVAEPLQFRFTDGEGC